jgi:hypothetical protein
MPNREHLGLDGRSWKFLMSTHGPAAFVKRFADEAGRMGGGTTVSAQLDTISLHREFRTASEILRRIASARHPGVLLADDVGLGKTTVAAIVAFVVAAKDLKVRILAPKQRRHRRRSHLRSSADRGRPLRQFGHDGLRRQNTSPGGWGRISQR